MTKDTVTLSRKDFDLLTSMYPNIFALKQVLEGVIHPNHVKQIDVIAQKMKTVFTPFWEKEEKDSDENYNALSQISDDLKFKTIWSISEVRATQLSDTFSSKVKQINYKGQVTRFDSPKNLSWLDMWKEADKLIRMSGDSDHIFIENFNEDMKNPDHYELSTGS